MNEITKILNMLINSTKPDTSQILIVGAALLISILLVRLIYLTVGDNNIDNNAITIPAVIICVCFLASDIFVGLSFLVAIGKTYGLFAFMCTGMYIYLCIVMTDKIINIVANYIVNPISKVLKVLLECLKELISKHIKKICYVGGVGIISYALHLRIKYIVAKTPPEKIYICWIAAFIILILVAVNTIMYFKENIITKKKETLENITNSNYYIIRKSDFKAIFGMFEKVKLLKDNIGYYVNSETFVVIRSKAESIRGSRNFSGRFVEFSSYGVPYPPTQAIYYGSEYRYDLIIVIDNKIFIPYDEKDRKDILKIFNEMLSYLVYREKAEEIKQKEMKAKRIINESNHIISKYITKASDKIVDDAKNRLLSEGNGDK